ncbi:MAG: alpha-glucan family phosphorylase [Desulfobacterales bacterium]|jgi:starch phosphorylase|nr:alpha-glucan family phosphorylase [Desulfobacterales bacterium]
MSYLQTFQVFPMIPEPLLFLEKLSRNLWWCWQPDAIELFRRIDPKGWENAKQNPIVFSTFLSQRRLEELSRDNSFLAHQERVKVRFEQQVLADHTRHTDIFEQRGAIAYFSMEFGVHESLPLFAGGLGVLAGDHLKSSSDLNLPMVGVGLLYRQGYFQQYLSPDAWQQEAYPDSDLFQLPIKRVKDSNRNSLRISITGPEGPIHFAVWVARIGRVPLFLLDTNLIENTQEARDITARLYGGDFRVRLAQEMVLGIGGMRALYTLGIDPIVTHMNEGHSAFANLERLSQTMVRKNLDFKTALQIIPRATVFTTHTPVSAGHDEFPPSLVRPYIAPLAKQLKVTTDEILAMGQHAGSGLDAPFSMFILGLRMSQYCNGVSKLHGSVARKMWSHVWPGHPEDEVPISHVTNGIHAATWISPENADLFEQYLGSDWSLKADQPDITNRIDEIYNEELWRAHEVGRTRLIRTCRKMMARQYSKRNASKAEIESAESVLDQGVLTIGFARRFATYKRAHLLLQDPDRLRALLNSEIHPIQIIFAGKAHPKDNEGKMVIQQLIQFVRNEGLRHRVIFLEDYDMQLARYLVQGADVWLNTPRRPLEACGTSGMKAALNGVLNVSILDGWWCEGYSAGNGWRIGNGEDYNDHIYQDAVESQALYNVLENNVIPCFYDRKEGDAPERWLTMMKASMKMALSEFSGQRMVSEYESRFYLPAAKRYRDLFLNDCESAKAQLQLHERFLLLWKDIRIKTPQQESEGPFRVGNEFRVTAHVQLGAIKPEEVDVEVYYGLFKTIDSLALGQIMKMQPEQDLGDGAYRYVCNITFRRSGRFGFTARVRPRADGWIKNTPGFITWAD